MRRCLLLFVFAFFCAANAHANATMPQKDIAGSSDSPLVGRFQGSYIVSYLQKGFEEISFPLSALKAKKDKRDNHNNIVYEPENLKTVEGKRTHLVYVNPAGVSPLEVIRNYQVELEKKGGKVLYSCKGGDCGGSSTRSSSGGGGDMSLSMYLWPEENIRDAHFSNGHCAQTAWISDQRYLVMELPQKNSFVSVHTYLLKDNRYCKAFNDVTIAVVDVMAVQQMQAKMVTLKAEEMAEKISASGSVALYGIYFDFNKADVKPESEETLVQIAKLLNEDPALKLLVVGHTDNKGSYEANMDLSKRRAEAVVKALTTQHGINASRLQPVGVSFACPVATNASDEGRAKNRRVELVKR